MAKRDCKTWKGTNKYFSKDLQETITSLDDLVHFAKLSEPKVRACYSENIELTKEQLVEVILVDGGFLIELFKNVDCWLNSDAKLSKQWWINLVIRDLLLLENQLPFFFLEELFNRAFFLDIRGDYVYSFRKLTYDFFAQFNIQNLELNHMLISRINHFTDLLRLFHLPRQKPPRKLLEEATSHVLRYTASELYEAGLKFKINRSKCLLDLKFSGRVLEIPEVMMDGSFKTLFHNMIALEQCHYPSDSYITDYAIIMDSLINTNKDVEVLIHKEIICNYLADSNDVVKVFNDMSNNTVQVDINSDYIGICESLNGFYKDPWNRTKATLRRDYCKTPWQTAASIAAIVLLIFTLVQTIFSILDYVK